MSFRTLNGLAAGTALLVLMGALKLLESKTRRDDAIVVGVALFLLLAAALANQALWRLPLYLLTVWGACAAMALIAHPDARAHRARGAAARRRARWRMALPLALACFLFFPRMAGQFWSLRARRAGDHRPLRRDVAGRHRQAGQRIHAGIPRPLRGTTPPPRGTLYWRGPVLNDFDGYTWRRERRRRIAPTPMTRLGEPVTLSHFARADQPALDRSRSTRSTRSPRPACSRLTTTAAARGRCP